MSFKELVMHIVPAPMCSLLIAVLTFASCRQTSRQAVADTVQPTDSTKTVTCADTLRLVIADKKN